MQWKAGRITSSRNLQASQWVIRSSGAALSNNRASPPTTASHHCQHLMALLPHATRIRHNYWLLTSPPRCQLLILSVHLLQSLPSPNLHHHQGGENIRNEETARGQLWSTRGSFLSHTLGIIQYLAIPPAIHMRCCNNLIPRKRWGQITSVLIYNLLRPLLPSSRGAFHLNNHLSGK